MTSPEKLGIAVIIVFLAVLGYFLFDFMSDDGSGVTPDTELLDPQAESDEDPEVDNRIIGTVEMPEPETAQINEGIDSSREKIKASEIVGIIFGKTVDESGKPIEGVTMSLMKGQSSLLPHLPAKSKLDIEDITNRRGDYELVGIREGGDYTIVANHPEYAETVFSPVKVRAGKRTEVPDIVMGSGTLVRGVVTDIYKNPIIGALIQIQNPIRIAFQDKKERKPWKQMLTNELGAFSFENVSFKTFEVTASAEGFATKRVTQNVQFEGKDEMDIDFQLEPGVSISGYVIAEDRSPIAGARIEGTRVRNKDYSSFGLVMSEEDGSFNLQGLAEGAYVVTASKEEYSDEVKQGVQAGETQVELVLKPRGGVSGNVLDWKTHSPLTQFKIRVLKGRETGKGRPNRPTKIVKEFKSPDGAYTISNLDPGTYSFQVTAKGYADSSSEDISVVRDYTIDNVDIYMNTGGEISGRVVDAKGAGLKGVKVVLNENNFQDNPLFQIFSAMSGPDGSKKKKRIVTDETGRFHMKLIVPGTYQVAFTHPDYSEEAVNDVEVLLGEGATLPLPDVVMQRGCKLFGTVFDTNKQPVQAATVVITQSNAFMKQTTTNKQGKYAFSHLSPGEYLVSVQITRMKGKGIDNIFQRLLIAEKSKITVFLEDGEDEEADINLIE